MNYLKTIFYRFFDIAIYGAIIFFLLCCPNSILAQSSFQGKRLEDAIINYVKQNNKCESEVEIKQQLNEFRFTQSGIKANIRHQNELTGMCKVTLDFVHNGEVINSKDVKINVKLFAKVPAATRFIAKGDKIAKEDIVLKRTEVTKIDPNSVVEIEEAVNKQASKNIAKSQVVLYSDINNVSAASASDVAIKKGDKVRIWYYSGAICIKTDGFALDNGTAGSVIKVKKDNKTLTGFIADDGNVIVDDQQNITAK